jgi:hypothetical protein
MMFLSPSYHAFLDQGYYRLAIDVISGQLGHGSFEENVISIPFRRLTIEWYLFCENKWLRYKF